MSSAPAGPQCTLESTYADGALWICADCGFGWTAEGGAGAVHEATADVPHGTLREEPLPLGVREAHQLDQLRGGVHPHRPDAHERQFDGRGGGEHRCDDRLLPQGRGGRRGLEHRGGVERGGRGPAHRRGAGAATGRAAERIRPAGLV